MEEFTFPIRGIIDTNNETWVNIDELISGLAQGNSNLTKEYIIGELLKLRTSLIQLK